MKAVHFAALAFGVAVAFLTGFLIGRPPLVPSPSAQEISEAQQAADRLLPPIWVSMFQNQAWLKTLRRRGYIYCYRDSSIDADCARKQDEAVQSVFFALDISKPQQKMADQSDLSLRERVVARDPQLRSDIIRNCSRLYREHGKQDVRVLAICLGNLSEYSPLVAIPAP